MITLTEYIVKNIKNNWFIFNYNKGNYERSEMNLRKWGGPWNDYLTRDTKKH